MSKRKYFFDPQTLSYKEAKRGFKYYFWRGLGVLSFSLALAFALFMFFTGVVDSPKERLLRRENQELKEQFSLIEQQIQEVELALNKLNEQDEEIYRTIFEAAPLSDGAKKAGIGGNEKYAELQKLKGGEFYTALRKQVDQLEARMNVQKSSFEDVMKMAKNKKKFLASIPSIQPVSNKDLNRLASGFGYRIDPFYRTKKLHAGIDFTAPKNTDIYATADGKVVSVKSDIWGYGKHIIIDHGYGYQTLYAHLNKFDVKPGQKVTRGQLIGKLGSTGKSTGPHLHYEVRINGQPVNPAYFFHNDINDEEFKRLIEIASSPNQSFD
jgi:murein DD-endopeptidase MepM/ murein hydrolase activator NlpD